MIALYLSGVATTLLLLALSCTIGHALALPLAVALARRNLAARTYVYVIRGTPLLVQLFLIYFGLPQISIIREGVLWSLFGNAFACAVMAFALNTSAYTAAVVASSIAATNFLEIEAARAFGMTETQVLTRIVLPSAVRRSLPAYANEIVLMLHATAIAGSVTVLDLTAAARIAAARSFAVIESYLAAALLYGAIVATLTTMLRACERAWLRST